MENAAKRFSTFLGVDLGGGKGKSTAVARLERQSDGVAVVYVSTKDPAGEFFYDTQLLQYLSAHSQGALLAIDAPLRRTVCVRCRLPRCLGHDHCPDPVVRWFREHSQNQPERKPQFTPYTQRVCEVLLKQRHGILPRETLGQGMGPLTARAHYLCRALEETFTLNRNLLEVYPKATIHALCGVEAAKRYKREVNTWATRARILEQLKEELRFQIWREGCLKNDHCFDAVICAYTAYLWQEQAWRMPAEDREVLQQDGWIWFPPLDPTDSSGPP